MTALWACVLVAPYLAFAVVRVRAWLRRRRWAREAAARAHLPMSERGYSVMRPFSVYVNGQKLSFATAHDLHLGESLSSLIVKELVPDADRSGVSGFRALFASGETCSLAVGPINGETVELGAMRVRSLDYHTEYKTGITTLTALLEGQQSIRNPPQVLTVQKAFVYPAGLGPEYAEVAVVRMGQS